MFVYTVISDGYKKGRVATCSILSDYHLHHTHSKYQLLPPTMSSSLRDHLEFQYDLFYARFQKSLKQLLLLTNWMSVLQVRCTRAGEAGQISIRYNLRLKLSVLEGLRASMYDYSCRQADSLDHIQQRLTQVESVGTDSDSDCEMII